MAAPAPRRAAPATFWTMRRWPMRTALPPRRRAVAPELPEDVIVAVARYHDWAPPLLDMLATCKSWRKALLARGSEVWEPIALRRFPRLTQVVAHRTTPGPIDYKALYEAQLGLEEVKRRRLPASSLPKLSDFLFTFEVLEVVEVNPARGYYRTRNGAEEFQVVHPREVEEKVVGSWTGVFEDWDGSPCRHSLEIHDMNWTDELFLQYLSTVTRPGFTEEDYDRIPERAHPELKCRCILTLRSDMTRTAVIYDAKLDESACAKLDPDGIFEFENSFSKSPDAV